MGDDRGVISQSRPVTISSKLTEIEFGYHHDANDSYVVYPGRTETCLIQFEWMQLSWHWASIYISGFDDTTVVNYGPDGSFINHQQTVTLVVHAGHNQVPLVCWILLLVLLLSTIVSIVIICCFCIRAKRSGRRNERSRVASHINGFAPTLAFSPVEMMPKYAASPAQSYSTQKLYQWCQQKEMQQYKSLWAVNPTSGRIILLNQNHSNFMYLINFRSNFCHRSHLR